MRIDTNLPPEQSRSMDGTSTFSRVFSKMVEEYGFAREGGGRRIAGIWRGFPVVITMKGIKDYGRLELQMGVGSEYRVDDFRRAAGKMSGWMENAANDPRNGLLSFDVRFKNETISNEPYTFEVLRMFLDTAAKYAQEPPRTCEWCGEVKTDELVIDGKTPRRMCTSCWDTYSDRSVCLPRGTPNYFLGVFLGALISLVAGIVWALILIIDTSITINTFIDPYTVLSYSMPFAGIIVGVFMARIVMWGLGRKDVWAYVISGAFLIFSGVSGMIAMSAWWRQLYFNLDTWRDLYESVRFLSIHGVGPATGVFICITVVSAVIVTRQLLSSYTLVRIQALEKRAAKWEYLEDQSVRIG